MFDETRWNGGEPPPPDDPDRCRLPDRFCRDCKHYTLAGLVVDKGMCSLRQSIVPWTFSCPQFEIDDEF